MPLQSLRSDLVPDNRKAVLMPLVSVVLPCFRAGRYLRDAIDSVRSQTLPDWELVLVDNNAAEDLEPLRVDERIRIVREPRQGIGWARNAGVEASRGKYVAFLDEDDLWHPSKLEKQVAALEAHPGAEVCHTGLDGIDASDNVMIERELRPVGYSDMLGDRGILQTSALMVTRSLLLGVGCYDPTFRYAQDFDLGLRLLYFTEALYIEERLARYRFHSGNLSHGYWYQGHEALRSLAEHRKLAFLEHRWSHWLAACRGTATIRHGYSRNALARAKRVWQADGPARETALHLARAIGFSPVSPAIALAIAATRRGPKDVWPSVDSWHPVTAPEVGARGEREPATAQGGQRTD